MKIVNDFIRTAFDFIQYMVDGMREEVHSPNHIAFMRDSVEKLFRPLLILPVNDFVNFCSEAKPTNGDLMLLLIQLKIENYMPSEGDERIAEVKQILSMSFGHFDKIDCCIKVLNSRGDFRILFYHFSFLTAFTI